MKIISLTILSFFFLINSFSIAKSKIKNDIVVKIENEIITEYEIKNKILTTLILSDVVINQQNINKIKKQVLNRLIELRVKKIELSKYNIKIDRSRINIYLNSISSNDVDGLKKKFKDNNLDYEIFLDEIEVQFKWQNLIYEIFSSKIEIDPNSLDKEFEDLIKNETEIEEFRLSEIEILTNNNELDKNNISEIENQIREIGFESTALKFSISDSSSNKGDLGWINAKTLSKEIYNVIYKMNIGEVTKPIKRQNSVIILKIKDKKISKIENIDLKKAKKNLIERKKNELFDLYSRSHISKLKNNMFIQNYINEK